MPHLQVDCVRAIRRSGSAKTQAVFSDRANERDELALVAAVDAEIFAVRSDDFVVGIQFAHSDQTKVS